MDVYDQVLVAVSTVDCHNRLLEVRPCHYLNFCQSRNCNNHRIIAQQYLRKSPQRKRNTMRVKVYHTTITIIIYISKNKDSRPSHHEYRNEHFPFAWYLDLYDLFAIGNYAAVAAGFLVSNFLGAFLAGAAGAAAGFDGAPLLFAPAFNFLGFFFSGAFVV